MAKPPASPEFEHAATAYSARNPGPGGETHQTAATRDTRLTTNQGNPVSDNQNSLKAGPRGPSLLEDFILREKITHFDHERIPERIVHARGSAAHGFFEPYQNWSDLSCAAFLSDPAVRTPVFVRFSTVAGGAGSVDLPRDVRGFAVKFYTSEGNFDLVGNNIPVFFIQDAIKFPDLIHAVKMEADRGYPQAASAHDTFWDFASLMPETTHMLMWAMSDRAIPRSLRMIEGFGIHTFRLVNAEGKSTFVKFHWRPKLGLQSVVWDEAVKINGADNDFHRRDLFTAIEQGDFPEWELCVQAFDQETADRFEFDILDATKVIPEEFVPLTPLGRMVLDKNPDNFFAETEQVAYHPGHVVPGIDFTDDPLLHGRLFSYTDTQLSRLGGPNFHELPINRPRCPFMNFQRDGIARHFNPPGRANYEPNSLDSGSPRENPHGFRTVPDADLGPKVRQRSETFADHYSQARQFFRSQTEPEQMHIISAFAFELAKVSIPAIRKRVLGHLDIVDARLGKAVAEALGMEGQAEKIEPARAPIDLPESPTLSIIRKSIKTLKGRKIGVLMGDGADDAVVDAVRQAAKAEGAQVEIVAPRIGGATTRGGKQIPADHTVSGGPSVLFDAVVIAVGDDGAKAMLKEAGVQDWIANAFAHLKFIGHTRAAQPLLDKAAVEADEGVIAVDGGVDGFIAKARDHRLWAREPKLRSPG